MHDPADVVSALQWSVTAMADITARLPAITCSDRARALGTIGEAVWLVTIVDATLVRHHPESYDNVMAGQVPAERRLIEGTLAGLRFVRNRIGIDVDLGDLVRPVAHQSVAGPDRVTEWQWAPAPAPELDSLSARGQAWEMTRYQAYQAQLAGHAICEAFGRAAGFLELAAAKATDDIRA